MHNSGNNARRIIHGHDGPVEIDPIRRTVAKTYLFPEHDAAVASARREVVYASRLHVAFSASAGIACPAIISCDLSPPPRIIMSLCPGEPLATYLERTGPRHPPSAAIAGKICDGLDIYTRLFDEPYYDLCFQNILYEELTGVVTFLDFGIPAGSAPCSRVTPLEASLGNLIGCTCYGMVRPARLFSLRGGHLQVLREVVAEFGNRVSRQRLRDTARSTFHRLTRHGSAARRGYYATLGAAMSNACLKNVLA
jgi:hypothetical protein